MSEDDNWYVAKTQDDGVIARLQAEVKRLREQHQHMLDGPLTTAQQECHRLRAENWKLQAELERVTKERDELQHGYSQKVRQLGNAVAENWKLQAELEQTQEIHRHLQVNFAEAHAEISALRSELRNYKIAVNAEIETMRAENEALRRLANAAKRIDQEAQFCWEFCPDELSDEFQDALCESFEEENKKRAEGKT